MSQTIKAFREECAEHKRELGESDPVMVSLCIGRALMRFRAELDNVPDYDIIEDPEGYLQSCLLGLMHFANSEGLNFAEDLTWARKAFAEDIDMPAQCFGMTLAEIRESHFENWPEISDEMILRWMAEVEDAYYDDADETRFDFMEGHKAAWLKEQGVE